MANGLAYRAGHRCDNGIELFGKLTTDIDVGGYVYCSVSRRLAAGGETIDLTNIYYLLRQKMSLNDIISFNSTAKRFESCSQFSA